MSQELEIEFKNILEKDEFERLVKGFHIKEEDFILQHNHYFDTPLFQLKDAGCALRIREKAGAFELTLKQPAENGLLETNQNLSKAEAEELLENNRLPQGLVQEVLKFITPNYSELRHFGTLSTQRAELDYQEGLLVFDKSFYFNCEDFEIEYEVKDRKSGEQNFLNLLKHYEIPLRKTDNKIKRFFKEKIRQSTGDE